MRLLSTAGFRSAQRFQLAAQAGFAASHRYLALYETDGESAQEVIDRLNATRGQRQQSRSIDNQAPPSPLFATGEAATVR
ncbi:MAG: hypothetical protein R2749_03370 [Acidimicrobiales bacterium]